MTKTKPYDAAKYLNTVEAQAELLSDALVSGEGAYIAASLGAIARARGITDISQETGLSRQALHKALSTKGNPTLATVLKVLDALDLQLSAQPRRLETA